MTKTTDDIFARLAKLAGIEQQPGESAESAALRALERIEKQDHENRKEREDFARRTVGLLDVVMAIAALDFSRKAEVSEAYDHVDAIAAGVNMLCEELQASSVSLKEKEVLLREIHHRVKNNLQVISSLLSLQSGQITDEAVREKYAVSRERIRAMALVHEKLYESKNLTGVDFCEYVRSLAASLNASCNPDNARICTRVETGTVPQRLKIDTAIPCALIMNELLMNAYKHAFPGEKGGSVTVRFGPVPEKENHFLLEVADTGKGMPVNFVVSESESLGMQLVHILTEQLSAQLMMEHDGGTRFRLYFPGDFPGKN